MTVSVSAASTGTVTGRVSVTSSAPGSTVPDGDYGDITVSGLTWTVDNPAWSIVLKSADEIVNGSSTLQDDDHLTFAIATGKHCAIRGQLNFGTNAIPDFKYDINASATPTRTRIAYRAIGAGEVAFSSIVVTDTDGLLQQITGAGGFGVAYFDGVIHNNTGSTITIKIRWAQNTSNASDTTVYAGSYVEYRVAS